MSKALEFLKKCRIPIFWTIGYIFVLWLIMHILFNFDIFNRFAWIRVSHARLHGVGGLTFGIITLAAIPLYIATTIVVARNQKPLISLPVPKFISSVLNKIFPPKTPEPAQAPEPEQTENESVPSEPANDKMHKIPPELRAAFIRASAHPNRINAPICNACSTTPGVYPENDDTPTLPDNLPLPPDFDSDTEFEFPSEPSVPIFKNIDLYNTEPDTENNSDDTEQEEDIQPDSDNPIMAYLTQNNITFTMHTPDILLTNKHAIASHTDNDFWIMDEPTWFAAGQTRESPIQDLLTTAQENNVQPVLYLGATNIMNLDEKRAEWKSLGIRIITTPSDL